jgi:hypothetical protein
MGFNEPHPSPERSSPTRLSMSGHARYKGWLCIEDFSLVGWYSVNCSYQLPEKCSACEMWVTVYQSKQT